MGRAEKILKGLASLREEEILCDVQLEAEGRHISAHKAVLSAASPYWKAMFSGRFKEAKEQVVSVKEVSFFGLRSVIECIYTTELGSLDGESIEHVLPAAHLLQMSDITDECVTWMSQNITNANCFKFLKMGEKFGIDNVEETVTGFILKNFVGISKTGDFEKISKSALIKYLTSDILKTNIDESVVFRAAKKWILANDVSADDVVEIMSHVRFGLIHSNQLLKEISHDPIIQMSAKCREMIDNAMLYHLNVFTQPWCDGTLNRARGEAGIILLPCGTKVDGYNVSDKHVDVHFISLPGLKKANQNNRLDISAVYESMSCVRIRNFLYLFGVNGSGYQNFAKRYDGSTNTWLELSSVPREAVVGPAISHYKTEIFLMGGMIVTETSDYGSEPDEIIDSVYIYDIPKNNWSKGKSLPTELSYAATAELNGNIYLTGGEPNYESASNKVWAYDIKAQIWLTKAPMNHSRCYHAAEFVDEKLYVIGGSKINHYRVQSIKSIEMYAPLLNQWTILLLDGIDNTVFSSFAIGKKILLVGGQTNNRKDRVSCYDIGKNEISMSKEKLPSDSSSNVSAPMILPQLL